MEPDSRTPLRPHGLRPLGQPRQVVVETDPAGAPRTVAVAGGRGAVERVEAVWRIVDEWWRERPLVRTYFHLLLEDGRLLSLFHDEVQGAWYQQRY